MFSAPHIFDICAKIVTIVNTVGMLLLCIICCAYNITLPDILKI